MQLQSHTKPENTNSHKHLTPSPTVITPYTQQHTPRRHKVTITISHSHLSSARPGHERTGPVSPHRTQKPELFTLNPSLARVCSNLTKPHRTPEAPQLLTPRSQWSRHLIKMPHASLLGLAVRRTTDRRIPPSAETGLALIDRFPAPNRTARPQRETARRWSRPAG